MGAFNKSHYATYIYTILVVSYTAVKLWNKGAGVIARSIASRAFALHVSNAGWIPCIPYGHQSLPELQSQE